MSEIRIDADAELSKKVLEQTQKDIDARVQDLRDVAEHRRLMREREEKRDARWFEHMSRNEQANAQLHQNHAENIEINRGVLKALNEIVVLLRGKAGAP